MCPGRGYQLRGHSELSRGAGLWFSGFGAGLESDFCPSGTLLDFFQMK